MESRYLSAGGTEVHYIAAGEGPPLVLLGGLASSVKAAWGKLLPHLVQQFQVYALELPGQGDSGKPARSYTYEYALEVVSEVLDHLRLDATYLMGASAGGLVALGTALGQPGRVQRLVLVGAVGFGREVTWGLRLLTLPLVGEIATYPLPWTIRYSLRHNYADLSCITEDLVQEYYRVRRQPGAQAALLSVLRNGLALGGLRSHLVLRNELASLQTPTLLLWGERDKIVPVKHAFVGQRLIPHAQLHIFPNTGHDPATERPAEVARVVADFLKC